jgi:hypothetical protein
MWTSVKIYTLFDEVLIFAMASFSASCSTNKEIRDPRQNKILDNARESRRLGREIVANRTVREREEESWYARANPSAIKALKDQRFGTVKEDLKQEAVLHANNNIAQYSNAYVGSTINPGKIAEQRFAITDRQKSIVNVMALIKSGECSPHGIDFNPGTGEIYAFRGVSLRRMGKKEKKAFKATLDRAREETGLQKPVNLNSSKAIRELLHARWVHEKADSRLREGTRPVFWVHFSDWRDFVIAKFDHVREENHQRPGIAMFTVRRFVKTLDNRMSWAALNGNNGSYTNTDDHKKEKTQLERSSGIDAGLQQCADAGLSDSSYARNSRRRPGCHKRKSGSDTSSTSSSSSSLRAKKLDGGGGRKGDGDKDKGAFRTYKTRIAIFDESELVRPWYADLFKFAEFAFGVLAHIFLSLFLLRYLVTDFHLSFMIAVCEKVPVPMIRSFCKLFFELLGYVPWDYLVEFNPMFSVLLCIGFIAMNWIGILTRGFRGRHTPGLHEIEGTQYDGNTFTDRNRFIIDEFDILYPLCKLGYNRYVEAEVIVEVVNSVLAKYGGLKITEHTLDNISSVIFSEWTRNGEYADVDYHVLNDSIVAAYQQMCIRRVGHNMARGKTTGTYDVLNPHQL